MLCYIQGSDAYDYEYYFLYDLAPYNLVSNTA
jgi:hypothetical protein